MTPGGFAPLRESGLTDEHGRKTAALRRAFLLLCWLAGMLFACPGVAADTLSADRVGRILAGLEREVPPGIPIPAARLRDYARSASARWNEYERRIGSPMSKWARSELVTERGGTVFYPFSGPDFATVHRFYPDAARYVLVAMQRAEAPPALDSGSAEELGEFLDRFAEAWKQFGQIGFFRTLDLNEEAKQPGLRAGAIGPLLAFAVRSGYTVLDVVPVHLAANAEDLEVHPGSRADASTWNSVRITLASGERRVTLDYVRMNLADSSLKARPERRAWVERMAANRSLLKAASHLPQKPYFSVLRNALLARAPSILQDETGIDYLSLAKVFDVRLYGRFVKPHALFDQEAQQALAEAYRSRSDIKPLPFRVSYQRTEQANLQLAVRPRATAGENRTKP
jgi:hypothetical protein